MNKFSEADLAALADQAGELADMLWTEDFGPQADRLYYVADMLLSLLAFYERW